MSDWVQLLARVNLAVAAAIIVVIALRLPARRLFGARIAYGFWNLAPLAALAALAPARVVTVLRPALPIETSDALPAAANLVMQQTPAIALSTLAIASWIAGMAASVAWVAWRQDQFARATDDGRAGPAVVGVIRPRIVTPEDFERRYSPRERDVVLAHERTHIARRDPQTNALLAAARCVFWFNPLVHLAARLVRVDQELACDADVVAAHPNARRVYAEAMLKTQLAAYPLPLGCYWPSEGVHPLTQRIALLAAPTPGRLRRSLGAAAVVSALAGTAGVAWAARPERIVVRSVEIAAPRAPAPDAPVAKPQPPPATPSRTAASVAPTLAVAAMPLEAAPAPVAEQPAPEPAPPTQRIRAEAARSMVEPGAAVRVLATLTDPDGITLVSDLTAFGSQSVYRSGNFHRNGSTYSLFTSAFQRGDVVIVTASMGRRFLPSLTGSTALRSGESGQIVLPNGQAVAVMAQIRAETPEEVAAGERAVRNMRDGMALARRMSDLTDR